MLHQVLNGLADRIRDQNTGDDTKNQIIDRESEREQLLQLLKQITLVLIPGIIPILLI